MVLVVLRVIEELRKVWGGENGGFGIQEIKGNLRGIVGKGIRNGVHRLGQRHLVVQQGTTIIVWFARDFKRKEKLCLMGEGKETGLFINGKKPAT